MTQYSSLLLVLLILCVASSKSISSSKVVDVDVICKEAPNPRYCSNLLNSKSGGAKYVIDIAINAERDLYSKQYSSMAKHTAEIMSFILECGDSLHKNKTSPLLAKSVDVLRQVTQVIQTIVNYLNLEK
ncbi:hypothetical protein P8452_18338 [Trifolium repens]|nr:hypothetical protein P8452_18338 [Trifolium repens]